MMMRGYMTFPVCHKCKENLIKCRYCHHFDPRLIECTCVERITSDIRVGSSIADPDTPINCPYYVTSRKYEVKALLLQQHRQAIISLAIAALFLMIMAFGMNLVVSRQSASITEGALSLQAAVPDQIDMTQSLNVTLNIISLPTGGSEDVTMRLDKDSLATFRWIGSEPPPVRIEPTKKFIYFHYGPMPASQTQQIVWTLAPERVGNYKFHLALFDNAEICATQTLAISVMP